MKREFWAFRSEQRMFQEWRLSVFEDSCVCITWILYRVWEREEKGAANKLGGPKKLGLCEGSVCCQGVQLDCGPLLFRWQSYICVMQKEKNTKIWIFVVNLWWCPLKKVGITKFTSTKVSCSNSITNKIDIIKRTWTWWPWWLHMYKISTQKNSKDKHIRRTYFTNMKQMIFLKKTSWTTNCNCKK
jgi:hypothetical protein